MSSSSLHIANETVMAKKKTREKDGLKWVSLQLMAGMTRDEVWRAYKEACQEVHEVTEEDFVEMMRPVSTFLHAPYACIIEEVWEGLFESDLLGQKLFHQGRGKKGMVNYYVLLNLLSVMMEMEDSPFRLGTRMINVSEALCLEERYYRGRSSYSLESNEENRMKGIVRQIYGKRKNINK